MHRSGNKSIRQFVYRYNSAASSYLPARDGVVVEFDNGRKVFNTLHLVRVRLGEFHQNNHVDGRGHSFLLAQASIGIVPHNRMQVVAVVLRVALQQPAHLQISSSAASNFASPPNVVEYPRGVVSHRIAKRGQAREESSFFFRQRVVGLFEDMMLALDEVGRERHGGARRRCRPAFVRHAQSIPKAGAGSGGGSRNPAHTVAISAGRSFHHALRAHKRYGVVAR